MTTETTLSDAEMVQRRNTHHPASNSNLESQASSLQNPWPPRPARLIGRLIANVRLDFELTRKKESLLKIALVAIATNRKFVSTFCFARSAGLCVGSNTLPGTTTHSSTFLIYGSAIRIGHKYQQTKHLKISNRQRNRTFSVCRTACFSRCTSHSRDMIPALAPLK